MTPIETYLQGIKAVCASHHVKELYAFGSVLTQQFGAESDIDLLVEFEPIEPEAYSDNYFSMKFSLQDLLNRPVDLLEHQALRNPFLKKSIEAKRQLIYAA
jgi:predicted nucleotidyltransferase